MEHRTLIEQDAIEEIADTLHCLPDDATRLKVLAAVTFGMAGTDEPDTLPPATFGDMDRPVGSEQLDGGTGPL